MGDALRIVLIGLFGFIIGCGGQSPQPCTSCAMVAGQYAISLAPGYVTCGIETLSFSGASSTIGVAQNGSQLTVDFFGAQLTGTLHADNSALFGPARDQTSVKDGASGTPESGNHYMTGFFVAGTGGRLSFSGTYFFVQDDNGCEVDSKTTWR
jgi:hypothetical protein